MPDTLDFLEPRPDLAHLAPPVQLDSTFDDMHDSEAEVAAYADLPLGVCLVITDKFEKLDRGAVFWQSSHKWITRIAAGCGTAAVIMAIFGLAFKHLDEMKSIIPNISLAEIVFAGLALTVAMIGLAAELKERWLLRRHQAELCRLLKFRFLLQPSQWDDTHAAQEWVDHAMRQIAALKGKKAVREVIEVSLPRFPLPSADAILPRSCLLQLVGYYRKKRIGMQRAYLENRAGRNEATMRMYNVLPVVLFFSSVVAAAAHYLFENPPSFMKGGDWEAGILYAGLAAACLPVTATWARTIRAAFEQSRNKSRFRAASAALTELDGAISADLENISPASTIPSQGVAVSVHEERTVDRIVGSDSRSAERTSLHRDVRLQNVGTVRDNVGLVDARALLQDMLWCEQILHAEHIEWLRLMVETEWYG